MKGGSAKRLIRKFGFWRLTLLVAIAAVALAFQAPRMLQIAGVMADLGVTFQHDRAIVEPASAGAAAGIRSGDRLDVTRLAPQRATRLRYEFDLYRVGSTVPVPLLRGRTPFVATVHIEREPVTAIDRFVWIAVTLWAIVVLATGCAIVVAHPNIVTWAFFVFTAALAETSSTPSLLIGISEDHYLANVLATLLQTLGAGALITLCVRFPDGRSSRAGRVVEVLGWSAAIWINAGQTLSLLYNVDNWSGTLAAADWLLTALFVAGFAVRYAAADPALRARLRWVGVGLTTYVAARALFYGFHFGLIGMSYEEYTLAAMTNLVPFTFAYAVLRQRVIDVRFVGGRAVLYAVASLLPFALFRMTDWLVRTDLAQARIASTIELLVVVLFGLAMSVAQRRVDVLVERALFRRRYEAERVVRDEIEALSNTHERAGVDALVVRACVETMRFRSAAVFERAPDGYERCCATGWDDATACIAATDPLVPRLQAKKSIVYLLESDLAAQAPPGDGRPALAVGVWRFEHLDAILFVGRHHDGESPDPTEERLLGELARAAGIAYARIESGEKERTIVELRRRLEAIEQPA